VLFCAQVVPQWTQNFAVEARLAEHLEQLLVEAEDKLDCVEGLGCDVKATVVPQ
jgi:hypothetical protein